MLYIQNQWSLGKGKLFKSMNPLTGEIVWEGNFANASQLNAAMHAAHKSHEEWSTESIQTRIKIIRKFYALLEKNKLPITKLISTETGKTHADAASEVAATLAKLNNSILAFKKRTGSQKNSIGTMEATLQHSSHGVMSVVGPFNFPLHLPNGHILQHLLPEIRLCISQASLLPWLQST